MKQVTVITRTKNSAKVIDQTLSALFSQDFQDFDLHVVDSGSTDATLEIVQKFPCRVHRIAPQEYFPANVLNQAIMDSTTPLIVFLNSDTVPLGPSCLTELLRPFEDQEVQATFGRQVARPGAELWVQRDYENAFPYSGNPPSSIPYSLPIAAMRRTAWQEHPFYGLAYGSEDTEWGIWAKTHGKKIVYVPRAEAMHSHNYNLRELYARRFIEGEADAFIYSGSFPAWKAVMRWAYSSLKEFALYAGSGRVFSGLWTPIRQLSATSGYYLGHHLGRQRLETDTCDRARGQSVAFYGQDSD